MTLPSETPSVSGPNQTWYCVTCGAKRGRDPSKTCPTPRCGMRSYSSDPPADPVQPPAEPTRSDW